MTTNGSARAAATVPGAVSALPSRRRSSTTSGPAREAAIAFTLGHARLEVVRRALPFRLENDRCARMVWGERGVTLSQRDRLLDWLVRDGQARIVVDSVGMKAEPVPVVRP